MNPQAPHVLIVNPAVTTAYTVVVPEKVKRRVGAAYPISEVPGTKAAALCENWKESCVALVRLAPPNKEVTLVEAPRRKLIIPDTSQSPAANEIDVMFAPIPEVNATAEPTTTEEEIYSPTIPLAADPPATVPTIPPVIVAVPVTAAVPEAVRSFTAKF